MLVAEISGLALDSGDLVLAFVVGEEVFHGLGVRSLDQLLECSGQTLALEGQCRAHHVLKDGVSGQDDPFPAQQVHQLAQHVDRPAGDARRLAGMCLEQEPLLQGAEAIPKQPEDRLYVPLAGVVGDREVGNRLVVEVASMQIINIVADGRQLEAKETLAGSKVPLVQQKVDLGSERAALLERLALGCRQREEQISVALREARKAPQQLVLFVGEDLQAIAALGEAITVKIVER